MAEPLSAFVQRHKPDWDALERLLLARQKSAAQSLAELAELDRLYRKASADLARAQSFYPGSDVTRFLTALVGRGYGSIYRPRPDRLAQVRAFYQRELPRLFRRELRYVALSAGIFVLGILLGALVVLVEPRGAELLVPQHLSDKLSRQEIWTDDILTATPPGVVSSAIATNNLTVMIVIFVGGVLLGLGSFFSLAYNGVVLGAISALAWSNGMLGRLLDFVGAHGPVELSVFVVSGGAGLMLAHALIEPGELPRAQALAQRGREAVKLMLGVAPALLLIAFVEGYVSPGDLFPTAVKATLGALLGLGFWGYLLLGARAADSATVLPAGSGSAFLRSR